ncbi:CoA-acylating methylmalonate-semialdehyde dehydrogenase [Rhodococcus sp. PAMC28707]|uniref:CoA-acylating methylmalonate-semialdehyde dehydrogenase n=1 Tax=unclassified Rhodococcus (in: high G+C Gram-positive bacteria) TaxID=192944 RepID=UPI00109E12DD|nr:MULTISPECIES: CoA-acylating methylmalonate-semialdehyde dehydrogenase [unclassified Rhodococcus (in: high G+C Gram-positive bacteria)]QCB51597.1 CoA-acylating methylmalonate-semialdehyde dehydrogenase [Rhodococcus sp. PAMC28705]QCB60235.1 CoA-acylating methylmalonate-semialdehyde dehydrogenase [Rhodococcus sp. PAMC28707]
MSTPTAISHWIDGHLQEGASGRVGPVYNPATGVQTGAVALADESEANSAIASAFAAAQGWRETSLSKRTAILFAFRELLHANVDELAALITAEHGKVLSDAAGEILRGLENVEYATGISHLLKGDHSEQVSTGVDVHSTRQPLGVVAGITPFNFPVMVPLWMCANAIACGNAFILKPSEKDPSPSLLIADLWKRAGLPDGVFTVLNGDKSAVDVLLRHPDIAAISFVGSTPIARSIYETGTAHGKRVQALGGAKNHALILPDADLDMAADAVVSSAYGSAGERCMALSVAVAVGDMGDRIVKAVAERLPALTIGHGDCEGTDIGPLITREHRDRVASYIVAGEEAGATVVHDGRKADVPANGYFLGTTLLDHVRPEMTVYTDEIFGPVLSVVRVDTYAEGLTLINSNEFANGAVIFTQNGGAARQFEFDANVGMVGVNVPVPVPVSYYSFGGWKASLFGDNHMYGPEGVQFYTRGKVVTTRWPDPGTSEINLGFPRTR